MHDLILASTSFWRRKILTDVGLKFSVETPGIDESTYSDPDPKKLVERLAIAKADAVRCRHPASWVLGADQLAFCHQSGGGFDVWGKPKTPEAHLECLQAMRGKMHELVTGFVLSGPEGKILGHERTKMWVREDLEDGELERYVASGEGSQCAGGYAAEGKGAFLFSRIEGDWFNVLGLPIYRVMSAFRDMGWRFDGER